jgi:hypothetical protein
VKRLPTIVAFCAVIALGVTLGSEMTAPPSPVAAKLVAQTYETPAPSPSPGPSTTPSSRH